MKELIKRNNYVFCRIQIKKMKMFYENVVICYICKSAFSLL